ncbi:HD domain-containing phosphohydrolase [Nitrincola alkalilacustris]|uniref:HD domain-containing phosphohydrolase n=1 Tax=Nitrincola alkalilacustris TaxID=1571224 RepID=UPI00124D8FDC|nr:HD domain-containing phosphohydrolase [Nitrincola alkalilacustris]
MTENMRKNGRFPLHVHISVLFSLLLLMTGALVGLFNFNQTTRIILTNSHHLIERIEQEVQQDLTLTYQPIRQMLSLVSLNETLIAPDLAGRLWLLPLFSQALHDNPRLSSIYVGYETGDFFMLRPLRTEALKSFFGAPDDAAYQVWSIERSSGDAQGVYLFLDQSLNLISRVDKDEELYDPRERGWFISAQDEDSQITTTPYLFFSTQEIGTTVARRASLGPIVGADLTLQNLSDALANHLITPSTEVLLYDPDGLAVAYPDTERLLVNDDGLQRVPAGALSPALNEMMSQSARLDKQGMLVLGDERWLVAQSHLEEGGPGGLYLAMLVPEQEMLVGAYRIRWQGALITIGILALCLPVGWMLSGMIVRPLRALVGEAEAIRRFDFDTPIRGRSFVLEVDQLSLAMASMKDTIASFLQISASLSAETRFDSLLKRVLKETIFISEADSGVLYLLDTEKGRLEPRSVFQRGIGQKEKEHDEPIQPPAFDQDSPDLPIWLRDLAYHSSAVTLTIPQDEAQLFTQLFHNESDAELMAIALHNRQGETVGVLLLLHTQDVSAKGSQSTSMARKAFIEAVSGVAAICIESQRLLERQKQLMDAFIQLMAGAIDAKSPYTGGHCQRVPELTLMLAKAAADSDEPGFLDYQPTPDEWEALHIGAWLHDCGKVTTPEYVVDKATKLETIHDRIHEIRMRFEVLKRDAWINYWQQCAEGADEEQQAALRDELLTTLDEEFGFVAQCNLGGEAMEKAHVERLHKIAQRTWLRTLDNRIGIAWEEQKRMERTPAPDLPVLEPLLSDRAEHLIERPASDNVVHNAGHEFKLDVPQWKFNRGEVYNLSIGRGTLTNEERYIINHHIVQTILMLSSLPFPAHLKSVPEIAGGHHEKMDGTGYPKRLSRDEMSLPARMMAIADIFEALTAVDRPYKKGKLLSESLNIMAGMCRGAHIDPELFSLFVRKGIYKAYASRFMKPEQIDLVDEVVILEKAGVIP